MPSQTRARRVADRISQEIAILLQREIADPRLSMLTVTGAEVDRELAYATIYVSALEPGEDQEEILRALEGAKGFLRSRLAKQIPLRSFPQLRFRWDSSPDRGARVDELLDRLKREREASQGGIDEG